MTQSVAVVGVGAIGGTVADALAEGGAAPTLVARGSRRRDLAVNGLRFRTADGIERRHDLPVVERLASPPDVLVLAVKADGLPAALQASLPAIGPDTLVVSLSNGVPWWYFLDGSSAPRPVPAVDPGGCLPMLVAPAQVAGSVLYVTAELRGDGIVQGHGLQRLVLGKVAGDEDPRLVAFAATLRAGGLQIGLTDAIRAPLWSKIALNLATNPMSVVTRATLHEQFHRPELLTLVTAVLEETSAVARAWGCTPAMTVEQMLATGRGAGAFRTSMLQDFEQGRPLELAPLADAVFDLADQVGVAMPVARSLRDLTAYLASCRNG